MIDISPDTVESVSKWRNIMNRIICDTCGAEYSETLERCPVCTYPRQGTEKVVAAEAAAVAAKVKGGRFSSKNVKKRQKAQRKAAQDELGGNPNKPLIIVIILLLIAILLVGAYIAVRFLRGAGYLDSPAKPQTTATTTVPTETTQPPTVPCQGIVMEVNVLDLEALGEQKQLVATAVPADTTDVLTFVSADPAVAEVDDMGLVTAVGPGQTTITITCGDAVKSCTVVCWFQPETTGPTEPTDPIEPTAPSKPTDPVETTAPTKPADQAVLKLDQHDVTCEYAGETFKLYVKLGDSSVSRSKVTWSTSDPEVATVENGKVIAVGKGEATITAEYNGQKDTCIVRCRFENETETKPTEGEREEPQDTAWKASHDDVSIVIGQTFRLRVTNSAGEEADVIWTMNKEGIISINGTKVTGRAPGTVTLTTTVDGMTFTCIVRVK